MDNIIYEKYLYAGKIAAEARDYGKNFIKSGISILELVEKVESKILKSGTSLSFPVNVSINEVAAHFSPINNKQILKKGDIVKLDVGSHYEGYIADTAITVEVETNKFNDMIKASSEALDSAIDAMKAGITFTKIGKIVEDIILSYGYKPIDNLTGHSLDRYELHSGLSVPNVSNMKNKDKANIGDVIAIEPFATNGIGHVISGNGSNIYLLKQSIKSKLVRDKRSYVLFNKLRNKFKTLPFSPRWCTDISSNINMSLKRLSYLGLIKQYPQLIEQKNGIVTQKEHTIIINKDECDVITL